MDDDDAADDDDFETVTISAQDMDGDDKTDLILTNEGWVLLYRGLGDYRYAPRRSTSRTARHGTAG